jgi:putative peptidoglycan lipid II flippase
MSLLRPSLVVGAASIGARLVGFARDVLFAQAFGAGPVADSFLAAFRFLDLVRRMVAEGGLNPALVPILTRLRAPEAARLAGDALLAFGAILLGATALVVAAAGPLMVALAPGLAGREESVALAALCVRLSWPLAVGAVLASLLGAALNAGGRYAAAAFTAWVPGLAMILVLLGLRHAELAADRKAAILAGSLSLAGLVQLAIMAGAARRAGLLAFGPPLRSPALREFGRSGPALIAAGGATQVFMIAGMQVASLWPAGVSRLFYAERVAYLASALIAAIVSAVLLPELARRVQAGRAAAVLDSQNRALEYALLIAVPAGVALAVLADPVTAVLFERGAFDREDAAATAAILRGLALGVPAVAAGKILSQTVFARGAVRIALLAALAGLAATGAGALALAAAVGIGGVGYGISLGAAVHAAALVAGLRALGLWGIDRRLAGRAARAAAASALMGAALWGLAAALGPVTGGPALAVLCAAGLGVYAAAALLLRAADLREIARLAEKA